MALTISNNGAVQTASYYLDQNQRALQSSIKKLASGKKIVDASADPGTLSVAMKVRASINRLSGAQNNIQNGIGFLEVQDGLLDSVGKIVMRMSELKGFASQDPMKGAQDIASYDNEFKDLQVQLYQISQLDFNGMSLFANYAAADDGTGNASSTEAEYNGPSQDASKDFTIEIYTSSEGSSGPKVSLHKSLLLSALTINQDRTNGGRYSQAAAASEVTGTSYTAKAIKLATSAVSDALKLEKVSAGVFEKAIENITFLRAQTGGGMSRLSFAADAIATQESNMRSALGRIEDVDIAAEAANLAKYSILMQASAAMVAQANSTSQVALMLLQV